MSDNEIRHLRKALDYAVDVIENYELDIRNSEWTGVNLVERGFCQGRIYENAVAQIRRLAEGQN